MPVVYDHSHRPTVNSPNATFPTQSMANSTELGLNFGSGFDFDFENMDLDALELENLDVSATIDYEQAFMGATLSIGIQENRSGYFQADSSQLVLPLILPISTLTPCHLLILQQAFPLWCCHSRLFCPLILPIPTSTSCHLLILQQAFPLQFCHPPVVCSVCKPFQNLMAFTLTTSLLSAERSMRLTQIIFFLKVFNEAEQRVLRPQQHWRNSLQWTFKLVYTQLHMY